MEAGIQTSELLHHYPTRDKAKDSQRILIVDDEESILWSLSRTLGLADSNYIVGTASSAEEAIEILQSAKVDVLITDLKLPKMNGLDLAKQIKELSPETRAIIMTAFGNESIMHKAKQLGCIGYVEKPFPIDLLVDYINQALDRKSNIRIELCGLEIIDLLQLYALKKLTVTLHVTSKRGFGAVSIENGVLTHAEYNNQQGPQALLAILKCSDAMVRSADQSQPETRTLSVGYQDLQAVSQLSSESQQLRLVSGDDLVLKAKSTSTDKERKPSNAPPAQLAQSARNQKTQELLQTEEITVGQWKLQSIAPGPLPLPIEQGNGVLRLTKKARQNEESKEDSAPSEELILGPEPSPPPPLIIPSQREERLTKIRNFVNTGVEHFKRHELVEAKKCWLLALRIDSNCEQAKKNLEVLEKVRAKKG